VGALLPTPIAGDTRGSATPAELWPPRTAATTVRRHHPHPPHGDSADTPPRLHNGRRAPCLTRAHTALDVTISPPTDGTADELIDEAVDEAVDGSRDFEILAEAARVEWGIYRPAIERWTRVLGRPRTATLDARSARPGAVVAAVRRVADGASRRVGDRRAIAAVGRADPRARQRCPPLQAATALRLLLRDAGFCIARAPSIANRASIDGTASPATAADRWAA
jgi:hypothetical protein